MTSSTLTIINVANTSSFSLTINNNISQLS